MQMFKEVPVGENRYQVGRLKADEGSYLMVLLTKKMREERSFESMGSPDPVEVEQETVELSPAEAAQKAQEMWMMSAAFLVSHLDQSELSATIKKCLRRCQRLEQPEGSSVPIPMPVMTEDGTYAIKDLEYDWQTVLQLTKESIAFNISPTSPAGA